MARILREELLEERNFPDSYHSSPTIVLKAHITEIIAGFCPHLGKNAHQCMALEIESTVNGPAQMSAYS